MTGVRSLLNRHSGVIVYIVMAVTVVVLIFLIQKRSGDADKHLRDQVERIDKRFAEQAKTIVITGREAIRSGCQFDNQRARQIRSILRRSERSIKQFYEDGQISRSIYLRNRKELKHSISLISLRDCDKAAEVLKLEPDS